MKRLLMWLKHKLKTNTGKPETFYNDDGDMMVGFRCECGELHDTHEVPRYIQYPEYHKEKFKD